MTRIEAVAIARAKRAENIPPLSVRFWSKVVIKSENECWPWTAAVRKQNEGYGAFWMNGRHHPANRVALQLSGIDVPDGMVACHKCDNPRCCNPRHLFVGTPRANNDDKVMKGRHSKGSKHGMAKLTDEQIEEIKRHKPPGVKQVRAGLPQELANKFGISRAYVSVVYSPKGVQK